MRDRVLAAAVDLLAQEGAAGLTARSLAARAETSAPALYELFGDKSGVVREFRACRVISVSLGIAWVDGRPAVHRGFSYLDPSTVIGFHCPFSHL